jgi:hypothetical protein
MRHVYVAALMLTACGLIDSDVARVRFALPAKTYSFNASSFNLPAGGSPEVPCGAGQTVTDCCNPPQPLPMPDCAMTPLTCEPNGAGTPVCTAVVSVSVAQAVNFSAEVPSLAGATSLADIRIERIDYAVPSNTLNVDVPPLSLYLAPAGVTDPNDPSAVKFGTVPLIPAMSTASGTVTPEPNANARLAMFVSNPSVPFAFIGATTVKVPSGTATPTGAVQIVVSGELSVGPF